MAAPGPRERRLVGRKPGGVPAIYADPRDKPGDDELRGLQQLQWKILQPIRMALPSAMSPLGKPPGRTQLSHRPGGVVVYATALMTKSYAILAANAGRATSVEMRMHRCNCRVGRHRAMRMPCSGMAAMPVLGGDILLQRGFSCKFAVFLRDEPA